MNVKVGNLSDCAIFAQSGVNMRKNLSAVRRGVVNVWVVMTLFLMVALTGIACDCGWVVLVMTQLQSAADAAALAGALKVKTSQSDARLAAIDLGNSNTAALNPVLLASNDGNAGDGDIVVGVWDFQNHTFTPSTTGPNAVKVNARREAASLNGALNLVFGPIFGASTVDVARNAVAVSGGFPGGGVLVLDPASQCAFSIGGNATMTVTGGAVQVNSMNSCGACSNGNPDLFADALYVSGGTCITSEVYGGQVYNGAPQVADPLSGLAAPSTSGMPTFSQMPAAVNNVINLSPGVYTNGIVNSTSTNTLNMAPGIYIVRGSANGQGNNAGGFQFTGGNLNANGIHLYIDSGPLDISGNGSINMSPMTTGTYAGVTIFQSRTNPRLAQINGTNNLHITGTMYFPNNRLDLRGTGDGFSNQIIAWQLTVSGNSTVTVPYNGAFPNAANRVFLVQ